MSICVECGEYEIIFVPACGDPAVGEAKVLLYCGTERSDILREIRDMDEAFGALDQARNADDPDLTIQAQDQLARMLGDYIDPSANLPTKHMVQAYSVTGKRWTRIRSDKMRNHWRSYDLPKSLLEAQTGSGASELDTGGLQSAFGNIRDQIKNDLTSGIGFNAQFAKGQISGSITDLWDANWLKWVDAVNDSFVYADAGSHYDLSAGAQLLRGYAGFNVNLGNNPETGGWGLSASADARAILASAQARLSGYAPHRDGWHALMEYADPNPSNQGRQASLDFGYFRGRLTINVSSMLGASIMGTAGIEYVPDNQTGVTKVLPAAAGSYGGVSASAFAGVEAGGNVEGAIEWLNPGLREDLGNGTYRVVEGADWAVFFQFGVGIAANAGAGFELTLRITYEKGKIMIRAAAQLVIGVGAKGEVSGTLGAGALLDFIKYLYVQLKDNDFSYLDFIEEAAFDAIVGVTLYAIEFGLDAAEALGEGIADAWEGLIGVFSAPADAEAYARKIKARPTELIFATPEVKGAVLYRLSETYFFSFEEHQEAAILTVIGTMQSKKEWDKVIARVSEGGRDVGREEGMRRLNWIMDGGSQDSFDTLVRALDNLPAATMYAGEPVTFRNLA